MSILVGPFRRGKKDEKASQDEDEDLLMFGYACKLYRDDAKALMEDSGQLLIPWMGDHSLMVDRYDVRNRLEDKNQFGLKSNLPHRPSAEEIELEEELDSERYLALEWDDIRVAEQEEEEKKRQRESSFSAVGFSYDNMPASSAQQEQEEEPPLLACYPQQLEHPPTSSVDQGEDEEEYVPPIGLVIPNYMKTPATNKLHSIIEKTAGFIVKQGPQMEIIIKAKQKFNPFFSFLDHSDDLFPYYSHIKEMLQRGAYVPRQVSPAPPLKDEGNGAEKEISLEKEQNVCQDLCEAKGDEKTACTDDVKDDKTYPLLKENDEGSGSDSEESDSDDDGGYLHPLLMGGGGGAKSSSKSSTPTPGTRELSPSVQTSAPATTPTGSIAVNSGGVAFTTSSIAFYSKRMSVNSAPTINPRTSSSKINGPPRVATSTSGASTDSGLQYSYRSIGQEEYPQSSYAGQLDGHGYNYPNTSAHYHGQHGEAGAQYNPDVYGAQSQYQHHHQYSQDGVYYDVTTTTTTADGSTQQQYNYQAYYNHHQSADGYNNGHAYSAPPPPPPQDILPVVTKTAEYVAKNGDAFERTVIERHAGDPRFGFMNPWDKSHAYYQMLKQQHRQRIAYEAYSNQMGWNQNPDMGMGQVAQQPYTYETGKENVSEPTNLQRLSESGAVSFKLQPPKPTKVFDPSSLVDLGTAEDMGEEVPPPGEEQRTLTDCNGHGEDGPPPAKKSKVESIKMGTKVEEFLTTVKAMFGTE